MDLTLLILLVEDEPLILEMMEGALQEGGFDVEVAANGAEALETLDRCTTDIAGLITDVRLGEGPDGWEIARHARELNPQLPVVYMTGDSAADWSAHGVPNSVLLQKPFAPAQLITAVATLLNEADSNPAGGR